MQQLQYDAEDDGRSEQLATPAEDAGRPGAARLWQNVLGQLQAVVTRPIYETYLRETVGARYDGDRIVVAAPSDFATEWLSMKLRPLIVETLGAIAGAPRNVAFEVIGA